MIPGFARSIGGVSILRLKCWRESPQGGAQLDGLSIDEALPLASLDGQRSLVIRWTKTGQRGGHGVSAYAK